MRKLFTPCRLKCLFKLGFTHFLSTTTCVDDQGADLCITLLPVKVEPDVSMLPEPYDRYYYSPAELMQSNGSNDVMFVFDLTDVLSDQLADL